MNDKHIYFMRSKKLIACMLLLLFSITIWAQESAMITGVVTDENKEPLIGVNIAIQNKSICL